MHVEMAVCPGCGARYHPLRSRAVAVVASGGGGRVRAFCSPACLERSRRAAAPVARSAPAAPAPSSVPAVVTVAPRASSRRPAAPPRLTRRERPLGGTVARALGLSALVVAAWVIGPSRQAAASLELASIAVPLRPAPSPAEAMALLTTPEPDVWIHPLPGPHRRLPLRNTRRFGAPREGMRPEECRSGHCGVDLGNARGEVVLVAHDGVVERVVREDSGKEGRFVRISHKSGTVVTSYMHLDRIRADLHSGMTVKAGEVVGSVGETGVQRSGPHLHFAVSVREGAGASELFIDPEPLLHLWPLRGAPDAPLSRKRAKTTQSHSS